jgi:predicted enzyme related to lactoylglutathione lyase
MQTTRMGWAFYSALFDWTIDSFPGMEYGWIRTVETDVKGAPVQEQPIRQERTASFRNPSLSIRIKLI